MGPPTTPFTFSAGPESPENYLSLLNSGGSNGTDHASPLGNSHRQSVATQSPLFTWSVKEACRFDSKHFNQYALIGHEVPARGQFSSAQIPDPLFLNTDVPWSAFICGSQGAGKSHTLSCILENCLISSPRLGKLNKAPSGLLFHYDEHLSEVPCEAAHLASAIPVTVLVSPSNYWQRRRIYEKFNSKIKVRPLLFQDKHLSIQRMHRLMAFRENDGSVPLYMEVIAGLLREMAMQSRDRRGFDFAAFEAKLADQEDLTNMQKGPLRMRMNLLRSFMTHTYSYQETFNLPQKACNEDPFTTKPGSLTIVDLSDALIDAPSACSLFDMCLALFFEGSPKQSKIVALDEAHKFLTSSDASEALTTSLLQMVREQRHKGARVVISTQEPTVSPKLLDLCTMTFVHRFGSPAWLEVLKRHVAGAAEQNLMGDIARLSVGEALLFAPLAALHVEDGKPALMGTRYAHILTRKRLTSDGGRSVMASDA